MNDKHVLIFFMDGVGLGAADNPHNPFLDAATPVMSALFGADWYTPRSTPRITPRATLVTTDANLGVAGRPQSATGQATILTGRNVPALVGEHYGPKPNPAVAAVIEAGTLFHEVCAAGGRAALLSPYPQDYFNAIASGKRLYSAVPLAATSAGLRLRGVDDLRRGEAVSPGFTNQAWVDYFGIDDIPILTLAESGRRLARLAQARSFSFFEHWPSDRAGHRGTLAAAAEHLSVIDEVLGGLLAAWDDENGLLIVTSDHGNIEEKDHRRHTTNPVPTVLVGAGHARWGAQLRDLTDIAAIVRGFLAL